MYCKVGSRSHYIHIATNFITTFSRPYIQQSRASRSFDSVNQILCYITTIGANTKQVASPVIMFQSLAALTVQIQKPCDTGIISGMSFCCEEKRKKPIRCKMKKKIQAERVISLRFVFFLFSCGLISHLIGHHTIIKM